MLDYVIFNQDCDDLHSVAKLIRMMDTQRALDNLGRVTTPVQCIGSYKGCLEVSWLVTREDFDKHIRNSGYVDNQESFLHVPYNVKQPCWLEFQEDGTTERLKPMRSGKYEPDSDGWTYRPDTQMYYWC